MDIIISRIKNTTFKNYLSKKILLGKGVPVKVKHFVLSITSILMIGCSMGRYTIADRFMKSNDYQSALGEYLRIAEMNGSLSISRDVRALTGAMIAYYEIGNYKNSFAVSKQVLSIDKYNSSAIFYAGMSLEKLNKKSLAKKVYRFYMSLSRFDPYYKLIKAKFNQLVKDEIEQRVAMAIKMENNISMDQIDANAIAVLYFYNVVDDPEWNSLSKGLVEMMTTDLSQVKNLKVLERIYLQKLIEEMQLGMSGLTDEKTVPRMGRLMKANNLISGAFTIKAGHDLTITSNLLDVKNGTSVPTKEFNGDVNGIFEIEKEIVFAAINQLGIQLTDEERKKIGLNTTENLETFKAFCRGLDQYDLGNYSSALLYFQQAIKFDPNFMLGQDFFDITEALESIAQGTFVSKYLDMRQSKFSAETGKLSTQYRLNQLSQNLDLGYLPGNDSRNGASEIIYDERFWDDNWRNRELLEPPPLPPSTPPKK